ncbi:hypothetical protein OESDEN_14920, partial [Oesophagostomum dentatum]
LCVTIHFFQEKQDEELDIDFESEATSLTSVLQRLKCLVGECDIKRKTCCVPMCGRVFDSVPVLAFHMSYSHHDLAVKSAYDTLCFVCGLRMDNVKCRRSLTPLAWPTGLL